MLYKRNCKIYNFVVYKPLCLSLKCSSFTPNEKYDVDYCNNVEPSITFYKVPIISSSYIYFVSHLYTKHYDVD